MAFLSHPNFEQVFTAVSEILDRQHLDLHEDDRKMLADAHKLMVEARDNVASPGLRELAHEVHGCDEVEIDDEGAGTSPSDEGTWVQAWAWLSRDQLIEAGLEEPDEDEEEADAEAPENH